MAVSLNPDCWVKANVNQSGFYRVNYDIGNWYLLISHLKGNLQSTVSDCCYRASSPGPSQLYNVFPLAIGERGDEAGLSLL